MNNLYFDTFKKEEKIFEEVVKKYKPELMPSWHHWWFYRYLQISPSYLYIHFMKIIKPLKMPKQFLNIK